jgi:hypothetical protein
VKELTGANDVGAEGQDDEYITWIDDVLSKYVAFWTHAVEDNECIYTHSWGHTISGSREPLVRKAHRSLRDTKLLVRQ